MGDWWNAYRDWSRRNRAFELYASVLVVSFCLLLIVVEGPSPLRSIALAVSVTAVALHLAVDRLNG